MADLQGPKLRLGTFADGPVKLTEGQSFRLSLQPRTGDATGVTLPHPEIFAALEPGQALLLDDGKVRLKVVDCGPDFADTVVEAGSRLSDRKGVNVPNAVLPLSPLTDKDRDDLRFALDIGVDWVALSFVQRPGGHRRGAQADRRPGPGDRQAGEAGGDRAPGRDRRADRRGDGRARRPRRRDAAGGRAVAAEADHPRLRARPASR